MSDFWSYLERAKNLFENGVYQEAAGRPDAEFPPGYPLVLAGSFWLSPLRDPVLTAKLVNCALALLTIFIAGIGAARLWGERAGLLAAALYAFYPRHLLMPGLLASENLFTPLLVLFSFLLIEACRQDRALGTAAAAGGLLGIAALARTVGYGLFALWPIVGLLARKRWRVLAAETFLLVAVEHAVLLPWALRNQVTLGRFTFLATKGVPLYLGNNPKAHGGWYDPASDLPAIAAGTAGGSPMEIDDAAEAAAKRWIRENPGKALRLFIRKVGIIFRDGADIVVHFAIRGRGLWPPSPGIDVLDGAHPLKLRPDLAVIALRVAGWLLFAAGGLGLALLLYRGLVAGDRLAFASAAAFGGAALVVALLSAVVAVNGRYRWPIEDLLIVPTAFLLAGVKAPIARVGATGSQAGRPT